MKVAALDSLSLVTQMRGQKFLLNIQILPQHCKSKFRQLGVVRKNVASLRFSSQNV